MILNIFLGSFYMFKARLHGLSTLIMAFPLLMSAAVYLKVREKNLMKTTEQFVVLQWLPLLCPSEQG